MTAIDQEAGTARLGSLVTQAMRTHVKRAGDALASRAQEVELRRDPLARRRAKVEAELTEARARTETAPPAPGTWRRRARPGTDTGLGAPLWRLVNPAPGVDGEYLDRLEAALAGSGLLDAWVTWDGELSTADGVLIADVQWAGRARSGGSLLGVLEPESAGGVDAGVVRRLLGAVGWFQSSPFDEPGDWLAADGGWRVGGLTGRGDPVGPASYVGAAAREAARQREIERLEAEAEALDGVVSVLDRDLAAIADAQAWLEDEERAIPAVAEQELSAAVVTLAERARRHLACERDLRAEEARHASDLTRRDQAWARFADYASAHRFGLQDLDGRARALDEYRSTVTRLDGELNVFAARQEALEAAVEALGGRERARDTAAGEVSTLESRLRQAKVRLATAETTLGADHRVQLRRRDELDREVQRLGTLLDELTGRLTDAKVKAAEAQVVLDNHERRRAEAEQVRDTAMTALWTAVDGGLAEPVGLTLPERRSVQAARELAAAARRELTIDAQATDEERAWRRCYQRLEDLRQALLPNRDARVSDDDAAAGIQQVAVLTDPTSG